LLCYTEATDRCPTKADDVAASEWLADRVRRLAPGLHLKSRIQAWRGYYLAVLNAEA